MNVQMTSSLIEARIADLDAAAAAYRAAATAARSAAAATDPATDRPDGDTDRPRRELVQVCEALLVDRFAALASVSNLPMRAVVPKASPELDPGAVLDAAEARIAVGSDE